MGSGSQNVPGQGKAIASLVLGIIAVVCWFFGWSSLASIVLGIVGLLLAASARKDGFDGNMLTAGFVLSLIGVVGGVIFFIACTACSIVACAC